MTKRNNAIGILTILILAALTASAQTKPKVVFIGDNITFNWSSAFAANKNWINEGVSIPPTSFPIQGSSSVILNRFRTDVINLHPAIVHIMIGVDDADIDDDAQEKIILPDFLKNLEQMVISADGTIVGWYGGCDQPNPGACGPSPSLGPFATGGFVLSSQGNYNRFDLPGRLVTAPQEGFGGDQPDFYVTDLLSAPHRLSINQEGTIAGSYVDTAGAQHGFVRNPYGTITSFDPPEGEQTTATSINDTGAIAGFYHYHAGGGPPVGFIRVP
jgi:hypothetical protein